MGQLRLGAGANQYTQEREPERPYPPTTAGPWGSLKPPERGWVRVMKTILQILLTLSNSIQGSNLTSVLRSGGTKRI